MTVRYRCRNKSEKNTFDGCNPALIRQLPLSLQAEFSAVLSHRSGLSKILCKFMRPFFQHGIGPHRLSKILQILPTKKYDELQLQYYDTVDHEVQNPSVASMLNRGTYPGFFKIQRQNEIQRIRPLSQLH
jgi:hypothetical protein